MPDARAFLSHAQVITITILLWALLSFSENFSYITVNPPLHTEAIRHTD